MLDRDKTTNEPESPAGAFPFGLSDPLIREQLEKILASETFVHAERLNRFLKFVVQESIEGRSERIKEYVLGLEVFDRTDSFDPRLDSIVRVEAHHLRARLREYYETSGLHDRIVIELPKGSYAPVFRVREDPLPNGPARAIEADARGTVPWNRKTLTASIVLALIALLAVISLTSEHSPLQRYFERSAVAVKSDQAELDFSSVAILPFRNLSREKDLEYLCESISQEVISALTRVPALRVVSSISAFRFRESVRDVQKIGETLNVGAVLEGSLYKLGDKLRLTAHLIDAKDGHYLWSNSYDLNMRELPDLHGLIAQSVVNSLKIRVDPPRFTAGKRTENLEAYNFYLKARYFQGKRTLEGLQRSIEYFDQSIRLDGNFALAHAGLADSWALLASGGFLPPLQTLPKAKAAALKALQLDPELGEVRASLAFIKSYYEWDWEGALAEYRRAIELNPGSAAVHHWYAGCLRATGLLDQAQRAAQRAQQLDPLSPVITRDLGRILRLKHEYDQAIAEYRKTLELDPGFSSGYLHLGLAYFGKSMSEAALSAIRKGLDLRSDDDQAFGVLGYCYATLGNRSEARRLLEELQELSRRKYVSPSSFAFIYIGLGNKDQAFRWLEEAGDARDPVLSWLKVDPIFDSLRSDGRFASLLKRTNLQDRRG